MTKSKDKKLIYIEPTIWYYLLAFFFPTMFFLVDDSKELIFEKWDKSVNTYTFNFLCLFMFFGVPILMLTLRREISIYKDRIIINHPTIRKQKTYQFVDLIKWNITDIYIPKAGRQINLHLKFKNKRLTFNKIELTSFEELTTFLETNYKDKKI
jgi:hypothetical protein